MSTDFTFVTFDPQEAFDIVTKHLYSMEQRCKDPGGGCRYLRFTSTGTTERCAIGALIDVRTHAQEVLLSHIQGSVDRLVKEGVFTWVSWSYLDLLTALQRVHDWGHTWDAFGFNGYDALKAVAETYLIDTETLDAVVLAVRGKGALRP